MMRFLMVLTFAVVLAGGGPVEAGCQPPDGSYTAGPPEPGEFTVEDGGNTLRWTDGREYHWVPGEPPNEDDGYYASNEPPEEWVNLEPGDPSKTWGTYSTGQGAGPYG